MKSKAIKAKSRGRTKSNPAGTDESDSFLRNNSILVSHSSKSEISVSEAIVKRAHDGVCVCHNIPDYPYVRFTVWNDLMTEITGYTMEEINRLGWYQTLYKDPKVQEKAIQRMVRMREGDDIISEEWTITRADGQQRVLSISTSVLGKTGDQTHVLAFMRDITEQKKLEADLIQARKEWEEIFEAIGHPTMILSPERRILAANRALFKKVKIPKNNLLGMYCYKVFHRNHPPENCPFEKLLKSYKPETVVMEFKTFNGVYLVSCAPVFDDAYNLQKVIHTTADITERMQIENALRASELKYRTLFESAPVGISILDLKGRVLETNNFFLWSPAKSIGKNFIDLEMIYPEDREKALMAFKEFLVKKVSPTLEIRIFDAENKIRWLEARAAFLEKDGKPYAVQIISQDITERKQAEEQLLQAQKMEAIGRLAGGVAHDFNNQLLVIQTATELLDYSLDQNDPRRAQLNLILKATEQSTALTRQLLAFSHKLEVKPQIVDLNQLLENLKKMLSRLIGEDIELEMKLGTDPGWVKIDPGQFEQTIINLAVNSRDAMKNGGKLIIETANVNFPDGFRHNEFLLPPGDYTMVSVSDTGKGMNQKVLKHIFEPFFTTKKIGEGTGLGLSIVYEVVKRYGGAIKVDSKPGKGTTFWIYLPQTREAKKTIKSKPVSKPILKGSETILLVEDNELVRESLSSLLKEQGYEVLEAKNSKQAIQIFKNRKNNINLLITDVVMPGMSGKELAKTLAQAQPSLKIILISGYHTRRIEEKTPLKNSVSIQKPFSSKFLLEQIRKLLDQKTES